MGTAKRERQKANRALRQQQEVRAETRRKGVRTGVIVLGAVVAVFGLVWIASNVFGSDDDDGNTSTLEPFDDGLDTIAPADDPGAALTSDPATDPASTDAPVGTAECPPEGGADAPVREFDGPPPMCIDESATYEAMVSTNKGDFTITLDPSQAPATVNNFVFLARNRYFDETVCHRIIPGFVVQCGDPTATGTGGPGYRFADELPEAGEYEIGSIAMANSGADTNGSQFFIITGEDGAALPPQYSLFGEVTTGFDETVVEMEAAGTVTGEPTEDIEIQSVTITEL